jgi:hypothetical protein
VLEVRREGGEERRGGEGREERERGRKEREREDGGGGQRNELRRSG